MWKQVTVLFQFSAIFITWKKLTCYKNPSKPSCIELILTIKPWSFQHSCVIETGLSDFHKVAAIVMKIFFEKLQTRDVNYRDYKYFVNDKVNIEEKENGLSNLLNACKRILDILAPHK